MGQHGALGNARRAAGVLQEGEIVACHRHRLGLGAAPVGECLRELHGAWQRVGRNGLLEIPRDRIDDRALEPHQIARRRDDDRVEPQVRQCLLHGAGEILQYHEHADAGIVELVRQFARGIERIDVDDRVAAIQRTEQRHRKGEHVRHHEGDAVTLVDAARLQPGGEGVGGR